MEQDEHSLHSSDPIIKEELRKMELEPWFLNSKVFTFQQKAFDKIQN